MRFQRRDKMVALLRERANFLENVGADLPGEPYMGTTLYISLTEIDWGRNEAGEYVATINEEGTKENIRRFLAAVGSCEKEYKEDKLTLRVKDSNGDDLIVGNVDRAIACKRVLTGQKMVPAKLVDEYEYVCDEGLSLLKLVS